MHGKSVYKGGKLIKVSLDYNENAKTINEVKIGGDFFLYPEDGREKIENALKGAKLEKPELMRKIEETLKSGSMEAHGFTPEQLADAILMACAEQK
jgi:hypothetical protein